MKKGQPKEQGAVYFIQTSPQRWSLDFVSDALDDGWRFRILCVVDDFTRECIGLVADTGQRVARELDAIITQRGKPRMLVSDNGTELTSITVPKWSHDRAGGSIKVPTVLKLGSTYSWRELRSHVICFAKKANNLFRGISFATHSFLLQQGQNASNSLNRLGSLWGCQVMDDKADKRGTLRDGRVTPKTRYIVP